MVTNKQQIALLLATYNAEKYLVEQIDSLFSQTNQDWTLYIRDDISRDNTQSIIDSYILKHPNKIVQIDNDCKNLGCRDNFYRLLEVIESNYYMFCDQDDVWLPEKVEISLKTIRSMETRYGSKMPLHAFCDDVVCNEKLDVIEKSRWKSSNVNYTTFTKYNYIAVSCNAAGANSIFNHNVKKLIFPLKNNVLMYDYWIALEVSKYGKIGIIDQPLRLYRIHDNQVLGITVGAKNTIRYKLSIIGQLLKQYQTNAKELKTIGYGPHIKYYWYKILTIIKTRVN